MSLPISVIIPAYNEEGRIPEVLRPVKETGFDQVIVVDDGSDDRTSEEVLKFPDTELLVLEENYGKAKALERGVEAAENQDLLFLDADLVNLEKRHLEKIVREYSSGENLMVIGVFSGGRPVTDFAMSFSPKLSGQRLLPKKVWEKALEKDMKGFGVEIAVNTACKDLGIDIVKTRLEGVTQQMKEEKRGPVKGLVSKSRMYVEVAVSYLKNLEPFQ